MLAAAIMPRIGTRMLNGKDDLLNGEMAGRIRKLLDQRGVLMFSADRLH